MNKILTYLFILGLAGACIGSAYAGTDMLANVLTQSNSYLKGVGLVQKKYSGVARKIVSTKVGVPDNLGIEKAEKYKEKAESMVEQAEKAQDRLETAKERKEELAAKYNELNSKAMEYKAKAESTMAKGMEIQEKYKTYKDKAEKAVADAQEMKAQVEDGIDQAKGAVEDAKGTVEEAKGLKDAAPGLKDAAAAKVGLPVSGGNGDSISSDSSGDSVPQLADAEFSGEDMSDAVELDNAVEIQASETIRLPEATLPAYNQADAIRSAAAFADQVSVENAEMTMSDSLPVLEGLAQPEISASEVMAVAASAEPVAAEELRSQLNIEEQLLQSSNRAAMPAVKKTVSAASAADLVKTESVAAARNKFDAKAINMEEKAIMPSSSSLKIVKEKADVEKL